MLTIQICWAACRQMIIQLMTLTRWKSYGSWHSTSQAQAFADKLPHDPQDMCVCVFGCLKSVYVRYWVLSHVFGFMTARARTMRRDRSDSHHWVNAVVVVIAVVVVPLLRSSWTSLDGVWKRLVGLLDHFGHESQQATTAQRCAHGASKARGGQRRQPCWDG